MRTVNISAEAITTRLRKQTVATLPDLMTALGTHSRRTVFRKLAELPYRSSYSHRGSYYTLDELTRFDALGLWSFEGIWFSAYGTLLSTAEAVVGRAEMGFTVDELDNLLHVGTKDALRKLVQDARLRRERVAGQFLYCAVEHGAQQLQARRLALSQPGVARPLPESSLLSDELRAAMVLFVSVLDEQQRRLYAGLESMKSGHGGDRLIAGLLGVGVATVARGRRELLTHDVQVERTRRRGGGRQAAKKKRRRSSSISKR